MNVQARFSAQEVDTFDSIIEDARQLGGETPCIHRAAECRSEATRCHVAELAAEIAA